MQVLESIIRAVTWMYVDKERKEEKEERTDKKPQPPDRQDAKKTTALATGPTVTKSPFDNVHIVEIGDSLASVARKYYNEVKELKKLNPVLAYYPRNAFLPDGLAMRISIVIPPFSRKQWTDISHVRTFHIVQPGERLAKIASKYDVDPDEIVRLNPNIKNRFLLCGRLLKLPEKVQKTQADFFYRWPTRPGEVHEGLKYF
jgi:LysM repeat protein